MAIEMSKGIRCTGSLVNIASANATTLFQVSNFAQQIGTKTVKLRKVMLQNNGAGNQWVLIGTGLAASFGATLPSLMLANNTDGEWTEYDVPGVEFSSDITIRAPSWTTGSINAQVEVEEIG